MAPISTVGISEGFLGHFICDPFHSAKRSSGQVPLTVQGNGRLEKVFKKTSQKVEAALRITHPEKLHRAGLGMMPYTS